VRLEKSGSLYLGHYLCGVEMVMCFVNVYLHCIVSNFKMISKISTLPHPCKNFCWYPCSLICVETSETKRWQNGKMERTAAKKFIVRFWNCKKQNFSASRFQRPGMTSSLKKLLADCFKTSSGRPEDWTVCSPCHLFFWHIFGSLYFSWRVKLRLQNNLFVVLKI